MDKNYVIGIDLGGTKICGALAKLDGTLITTFTTPTKVEEGESSILKRIIHVIDRVLGDSHKTPEDIKAIGIGSPGPLDTKKGIIITNSNLPFRNFNIVQPIEEKFGIKTYIDNDANAATIGEFMFGAGKGSENMIFVTVSTGVGGGAVLNGKVYRGNTSNALEVGHMTLLEDGPKCGCGNNGCLEALSSGTAIARSARKAVASGANTSLSQYENLTSYEVFKEAESGDKVAQEVLDKALTFLGIGIANIITNFDPEIVVIGGGVSKGGDIVFSKVKSVVKQRCFPTLSENTKIIPAKLGTDAGVIGAVALAIIESK